ncbi:hypothetical protein [Burkholderia stagnalis]|uniref:hypothetical protein n=1 Tax=Burkholderia stagnalis TaxID=1503054 RepID=UPI00075FE878|nr:hypothetical protein [Burkholderia stagnalis]KWN82984.1 hypothetical protein WT91_29495 [Burkholderia stagnalis]KWN96006.1 hypothetical protein WT92_16090 [Burkholderia stagnalis]
MSFGYIPESVDGGIKANVALGLGIIGAIVVCVAITFVITWALDKLGKCFFMAEAKNDIADGAAVRPASKAAPAPAADVAKAVHEHANIAFYRSLISAVEGAILAAGFKFGDEPAAEVQLPYSVLLKAADELSMARTEFMQPYISPDRMRQRVELDRDDGYSLRFVTSIINAMRDTGRYVQLWAEADSWVAVNDYVSNGLTESAVAANRTAQIHIRSE